MVNGKAELNRIGCPQGSIISPILSNIYLHHVIDNWFAEISKSHLKGRADMVRFADDMVFVFQMKEDAERFYKVLPKRLEKYGLKLHEDKSSMITIRKQGSRRSRQKRRAPTHIQIPRICMLLGKESKWSVAIEIQEPIRSIHGKTQRAAEISQGKVSIKKRSNHARAGEKDCSGMDKLSCHLR